MNYEIAISKNLKNLNSRRLCLWSEGILEKRIIDVLEKINIPIYCRISDNKNNYNIKMVHSVEELEGGAEKYFVFVALYTGHKDVVEKLQMSGFKYGLDFVATNIALYVKDLDMVDPLLVYTRKGDNYPGIVQFGMYNGKNHFKILVLGNSTSEHMIGGMKSWCYYLWKKLSYSSDKNYIIYNGGISGYCSGQEFLKLARDGLLLKPDIIISLSGVCDVADFGSSVLGKSLLNKYQYRMWKNITETKGAIPDSLYMRNLHVLSTGIESTKSNFEEWIDNERKMYALSKEFGIEFLGCLQPMLFVENSVIENDLIEILEDAGIYDNTLGAAQRRFIEGVRKNIVKYPFLYDMSWVLKKEKGCYFDSLHYTERGNKILADEIIKLLYSKKIFNIK